MVTSIIGRADSFDLVFSLSSAGQWEAIVPADLSDGTYAVEVWAEDESGNTAYSTAILYMFDGCVSKLEIIEDKFKTLILSDKVRAVLRASKYEAAMHNERYSARCFERMVVER
ncbi:MAG: PF13754 domain-containing protein [Bacillota bacterium]|nr:PF13754 domain-containing protein [Bacillota bacterium]